MQTTVHNIKRHEMDKKYSRIYSKTPSRFYKPKNLHILCAVIIIITPKSGEVNEEYLTKKPRGFCCICMSIAYNACMFYATSTHII